MAVATTARLALANANFSANATLHRRPWISWAIVYTFTLLSFFVYRLANLSAIASAFQGDAQDDSAGARLLGVLFGFLEDLVVACYLLALLYALDAALNRLSCCNDTAPNGCLDCFTHGLYFMSRFKLMLKRLVRFAWGFALFGAMLGAVAVDAVLVRSRRVRFSFDWLSAYLSDDLSAYPLALSDEEDQQLAQNALQVTISLAVTFAIVYTVWVDLTRWCPFTHVQWAAVCRSCQRKQRQQTAETISQPSINYIVIEQGEFFDSDDNQLRGTLSLMGQFARQSYISVEEDTNKLQETTWELAAALTLICVFMLFILPTVLTLIGVHLSPVAAHIALNVVVNEPVHSISGSNLFPSSIESP